MFSGIITDIGRILQRDDLEQTSIVVSCSYKLDDILIGGSISCSGVCLTITEKGIDRGKTYFTADISRETNERTTSKDWDVLTLLNLEPSLKIGDEIGGHFVYGHVDCVCKILEIKNLELSWEFKFEKKLLKFYDFIVEKASIAIDGISLTIANVDKNSFVISIIPHTFDNTNLQFSKEGDLVNVEFDYLARFILNKND